MNQILTIPRSIQKFGALLAIVTLLTSSLPIGVMIAQADSLTVTPDNHIVIAAETDISAVDATTYTNLSLSFDYDAELLDNNETVVYGWREQGGSNNNLGTISGNNEQGGQNASTTDEVGSIVNLSLGVLANNISNLEIYFINNGNAQGNTDDVSITNIEITGDTSIPPACSPQTNVTGPTNIQNASSSDYFDSVDDALADCDTTDGDTIELLGNISISEQITINRPITLDGNGYSIDAAFIKTDNSNNSAIGVQSDDVTIQDVTVDGDNGTDLHGINVYTSTGVTISSVTAQNFRTGLLVNGSTVSVSNITTSGNIWHAINVDQGSGVTEPSVLNISNTSSHGETSPTPNPHIFIDDISKSVTVNDIDSQYDFVEFAFNTGTARAYTLATTSLPATSTPPTSPVMPSLDGEVIFNSIPSPLPSSVPSQGYQATQTYELGDSIVFAGTNRELIDAAVTLTSWACQSGEWNLGTCSTTPGATFSHPITLNLYEVALDGTVGALIASKTQTFDIPYRPSADATCTDTKQWKDVSGNCFNGYNHVVVFDMTGVTVPDEVIFGIAFDTQSYGVTPTGANGPYNSLNVGLNSDAAAPYVGTDVNNDEVFWDTTYSGYTRGFKADSDWDPYKIAVAFTATATPPVLPSAITSPANNGDVVSGSTTLLAHYSDENEDGNDGVQWAVRSGSCSSGSGTVLGNVDGHSDVAVWDSEDFSYTFNTASLANGNYCFVFNPTEDAGGDNQRLTRLFTIENTSTPPVVTIEEPTPLENEYVRGMVTGHVTATDDEGMGSYYLRFWKGAFESGIDNLVKECQSAPGGDLLGTSQDVSCDFNSTIQPDGTYVFSAQFQDSDIQWGQALRSFIVDNTKPVVVLEEPASAVFATSTVSFTIDATDNFALDLIVGNIYQNGVLYDGNSQVATGTDDTYSFSVNLPEGDYMLKYNARDEAGNIASTKTYDFSVVLSAPAVPVHVSPLNNSSQNFNDFYFEWTDVDGAVEYEFQSSQNPTVDGNGVLTTGVWNNKAHGNSEQNNLTESRIHSVGANGTWYWQVRAINGADMESAWSEPWKMTIDMAAPAVPTTLGWNDSNGSSVADGGTTELVSGTALWAANGESDFSHYIYKYWNDISTSAYNSTSSAWTTTVSSNQLAGSFNQGEGTHFFCIIAVDNAGNQSQCSEEFTIVYDTTTDTPTSNTTNHTISGNTAAAQNQPGWLFNRDTSTQSPYQFVLGTSTIGTGSLFVGPITNSINGNSDKFIAELFMLSPIAELDSLSYDFNIATVDADDENEFYMNVYANFGSSTSTNFYDCRYNVVPTVGVLNGWTTVTFNPDNTYPVAKWSGSTSPHACPASPALMDSLDSGSKIRAVAINVGDTSANDQGVSGYFDNVVVVQTAGLHTETNVYNFEPAAATSTATTTDTTEDDDSNGGGGSSGGSGNGGGPNARVLGASTDDLALYNLLENIKNRIGELLLAQYVAPAGYTPSYGASGEVLGESTSIAQADNTDEEDESEETIESTLRDEEDDVKTEEEAAAPQWGQFLWIFVALWVLATIGGYWRKSVANDVRLLVAAQAGFGAVALILLAAYLFFGLTAALWPSLIVIAGSAIVYYLNK